ncbi:thioredoxin family protein [Heliorestis acidaminivorans]|uniref:Thioredoxin family protein n=1 Tax=Heliorestis acidaminivorans TaxID=553427 RepID=A0A6I0EYC0_9FIRM|nr:thioredoxin family protein [Heliorestis acidaminivorans]KAB2951645.1 thioredoxin family protein [Heliorestis acidaminivorans]
MDIKLFGANGCQVCLTLEQTVFNVLAELGVDARVSKIDDVESMQKYDVFAVPALVINEQVKVSGRVPSKQEIINWIKEAL